MKKTLLLCLAMLTAGLGFAQKPAVTAVNRNFSMKKAFRQEVKETQNFLDNQSAKGPQSTFSFNETEIGQTRYDLQTNQSCQNRIYQHFDGTISAIWTKGQANSSFPERGTGYNYFDGSAWGPAPTSRIETMRTGWPSIAPFGQSGEIVVSHTDIAGLRIAKRLTKGTGSWTEATLAGPASAVDISWPRLVTSGPAHDKIHIIATTYSEYHGLDLALLYYRSQDGGLTWDRQHFIIPGLDSTFTGGFGGDSYAWAEPKGDTLAFVVGDSWTDLILMKSTDGGDNWTRTTIFTHPYPFFDEAHTLVTDTLNVTDGSLAVALDNNRDANVFFGLMRVLNDDTTDALTSFFPYTDGIGFWKEGMPAIASMDPADLDALAQLPGFTEDVNNNDSLDFLTGTANPPKYYLSISSMPTVTIDANNHIFLFYSSLMESLDNSIQNYRHIYCTGSVDGGATWFTPERVTAKLINNFKECVFPSVSPTSDFNYCHLVFQKDDEPGLAVRGDLDSYTDNYITYMQVEKNLITGRDELVTDMAVDVQNYPNPFNGKTQIVVDLKAAASMSLIVTDLLGQAMLSMPEKDYSAGSHVLSVDATGWTPGIYFYTVKAGSQGVSRKMIVQ